MVTANNSSCSRTHHIYMYMQVCTCMRVNNEYPQHHKELMFTALTEPDRTGSSLKALVAMPVETDQVYHCGHYVGVTFTFDLVTQKSNYMCLKFLNLHQLQQPMYSIEALQADKLMSDRQTKVANY